MNSSTTDVSEKNILKKAFDKCSTVFKIVFCFAFVINLLMLITPLYSLQVLDRVLGSGNLNTLLMLSLIIALVYFVYGLLQVARSFTLIKIGEWLDREVSPILFSHSISSAAQSGRGGNTQLLRDFQTLKSFMTSVGLNTVFDAPWSIVYIFIVFMIHKYIGFIAIIGAIIVVMFGFFNAVATNRTLGESNSFSVKGMAQADVANRNAEVVEAMGMIKNVSKNWAKFNNSALEKQYVASYRNGIISNLSRFIRNIVQMAVTGVGAYVVVSTNNMEMTPGAMIASSIIVGRALAPFDNAIVMWKSISDALKAYKNINKSLDGYDLREQAMPIPDVDGHLVVDNIYYAIEKQQPNKMMQQAMGGMQSASMPTHILKGISFAVQPGEVLAVIGPSAAGKSTLAKLIVGVWNVSSGSVRLDGGDVYSWNRENFGEHVGYLPQGIELFGGTIKQNIARMQEDPDPKKVIETAKMCGAHEMILKMKDGYDTDIGIGGKNLSGGQRQRIGLARAFYGDPKLVVLDEPNANLDREGEAALASALMEAKKRKIGVIVISHRHSILSQATNIMLIENGAVSRFGTKDELLSYIRSTDNVQNMLEQH